MGRARVGGKDNRPQRAARSHILALLYQMLQPRGSEAEVAAEAEDDLAQLAPLLGVEVLVSVALLELRQFLCGGWVRGYARLGGVHSLLSFCGPGPGE
jgi:hypothetical protein